MNSIEDIAKMAIEEVGAELKELENSRIPTKAPKPLRAANDALNAAIKKDEAAKIVDGIKQNIRHWKAVAEKVGISRSNMMRMENCFKF